MLLCKVFSSGRVYIRVRFKIDFPIIVAGDASKPSVSWLKFEPWSRIFLSYKPVWLIGLMLLWEVFSSGRVYIRVPIRGGLSYVVEFSGSLLMPPINFYLYKKLKYNGLL